MTLIKKNQIDDFTSDSTQAALDAKSPTLPLIDTTALVKWSVDATKTVRIEADWLTTATERVMTMPDKDIIVAWIDSEDFTWDTSFNTNTLFVDSVLGRVAVGTINADGTFHVFSGSAGIIWPTSAADDLVVENSTDGWISILVPNANVAALNLGTPWRQVWAFHRWNFTSNLYSIGTWNSGAELSFDTDINTEALRLDSNQNVIIPAGALNENKWADIVAAALTDIASATWNIIFVTGNTAITSLWIAQAWARRTVKFTWIPIITHNATSLILPTTANITAAVDDRAEFQSLWSGNWICTNYQRADGTALAAEVTLAWTETLTNKRITERVNTITSSATPTPAWDTTDIFTITALAVNATFAAPTWTPTEWQVLLIRIKDNATARTLAWNAIYRASTDLPLPTTTIISKTLYLQFVYNDTDSTFDLLWLLNNF